MRNLLSLRDFSKKQILELVAFAQRIKKSPRKYRTSLKGKNLVMLFEKPSLRTRLSFEIAMLQLEGHAIYYDLQNSPLGKGKESVKDTALNISRYADAIMARLYEHETLIEMAKHSKIPVINGLTNFSHPCQVLSDLLTINEKFRKLSGLNLVYIGDANNNVTHSLMFACPKVGISLRVICPAKKEFMPNPDVIAFAKRHG
ncbi:MAG: ornithine carbamoyltransferase, partial [Nanoarchaeota archaeon]